MPTKEKRTGKWVARAMVNGERVWLGRFDTKKEAAEEELKSFKRRSRLASEVTVTELRDRWLNDFGKPRWKAGTFILHKRRTRTFEELHGKRAADSVTKPMAHTHVAEFRASGESLRAMFGYGVRIGVVEVNPFERVKEPPKPKEIRLGRGALTEEEIVALAEIAREEGDWLAELITFAAYTGLRAGELFELKRSALGDGEIRVDWALSQTSGEVDLPKSNEKRTVVYPPQAKMAVDRLPLSTNGYVFTSVTGLRVNDNILNKSWRPVRDKFALTLDDSHWLSQRIELCQRKRAQEPDPKRRKQLDPGGLKFHELRHTCATLLREWGVDPEDIAVQLGHTDGGELVRKVYGHPSKARALDRVRAAYDRPAQSTGLRVVGGNAS